MVGIQDFTNSVDFNENKWEKTSFEQTHTKACRNTLGIRANASGIAAKAELGRYPIIIYLANQSLKFYSKTITDETKLAHNAPVSEIELHDMGKQSWITTIEKICTTATNQSHLQGFMNIEKVVQSLQDKYQGQFFKRIQSTTGINNISGNKLRTYAKIKKEYKQEEYTSANLSRDMMTGISQLRTSTHKLAIETGRYQRPVIPSNDRVCRMCNNGRVEDETHFIVQCMSYNENWKRLLQKLKIEISTGLEEELFIKIMTTTNEVKLKALGQYILECLRKRKEDLDAP